jgi:hypothetical protein
VKEVLGANSSNYYYLPTYFTYFTPYPSRAENRLPTPPNDPKHPRLCLRGVGVKEVRQ